MERQNKHLVDLSNTSKPVYEARKPKWRKPANDPGQLSLDLAGDGQGVLNKDARVAAEAARSAAAGGEHRTAAAAGGDGPLFQSYGHCCDGTNHDDIPVDRTRVFGAEDVGEVIGHEYRVRPCQCRKWFCEYCGPKLGFGLYRRLLSRVQTFAGVFGITLTIDGKLFESPQQGWQYVMSERLLSRLVRDLDQRGYLCSKAYFWSVEFQKNEQPHWHMLVDALRIPMGQLVEIWNRFRPKNAPPLETPVTAENYQGREPAFGSVRFSPASSRAKAAYYATKYLCKYPKDGYPDWVLDRVGRMPRYGRSHRFFPRPSGHDAMCFCEECIGDVESKPKPRATKTPETKRETPETKEQKKERKDKEKQERELRRSSGTSIRTRLEACGNSCSIVQVRLVQLPDGTVVDGRGKFEGTLKISLREVCEYFGIQPEDRWQVELTGEQVTELEEFLGTSHRSKVAA